MSARIWIFLAALFGGLAVIVGAIGAHAAGIRVAPPVVARIFDTAHLYHALHALALLGVGLLLLVTQERRTLWSGVFLNLSALGFMLGILMFSGGIYVQLGRELTSSAGIVPAGGFSFILGWACLAIGALGLKR